MALFRKKTQRGLQIESLEARCLLSTTTVFQGAWGWTVADDDTFTQLSGVDIEYASSGDDGVEYLSPPDFDFQQGSSHTATLTGLPSHTMIRVQVDVDNANVDTPSADTDGIAITVDESSQSFSYTNPSGYVSSSNLGGWIAHSGSSVTVSVADTNGESDDGDWWIYGFRVYTYNPTVSVSGSTTIAENASTPATVTVSRDLPTSYNSSRDDAVPNTSVNLDSDGSALKGIDYSVSLSGSTATISSSASSTTFSVTPIADTDFESTETATFTAITGTHYTLGFSVSATVSFTNVAASANVQLSPGSVTITRPGSGTAQSATVTCKVVDSNGTDQNAVTTEGTIKDSAGNAVVDGSLTLTVTHVTGMSVTNTVVVNVSSTAAKGIYTLEIWQDGASNIKATLKIVVE